MATVLVEFRDPIVACVRCDDLSSALRQSRPVSARYCWDPTDGGPSCEPFAAISDASSAPASNCNSSNMCGAPRVFAGGFVLVRAGLGCGGRCSEFHR